MNERDKARHEALEVANELGERLLKDNPLPKDRRKFADRDERHAKVRRHLRSK